MEVSKAFSASKALREKVSPLLVHKGLREKDLLFPESEPGPGFVRQVQALVEVVALRELAAQQVQAGYYGQALVWGAPAVSAVRAEWEARGELVVVVL